jgi:hypothetical protein
MAADVYSAIVAASGAVVLAGATYWFTKKRERDAEIRKEKLEHYKEFSLSLSGVVDGDATPEGHRAFAKASNKLNLIAPQSVLGALHAFQDEIRLTNKNPNRAKHDSLLSNLYYEMRRDLGISPKDNPQTFRVGLWASGQPPADS